MAMEKRTALQEWLAMKPPRELELARQRFEDEFARPFIRSIWDRIPEEVKAWTPAVDVFEKGEAVIVKVELPGMKEEDIDVSVSEDMLTIKGERHQETAVKDDDYDRSEILHGSFYRRVSLPAGLDTKNVEATYENGILRVTLMRMAGAKPKKVNVKIKKAAG